MGANRITRRMRTGTASPAAALALAVVLAVTLAAAGCSAPPPPGAPVNSGVSQLPTASPSAAATASGAEGAHRGTVPADTYDAIVKAMKAAGMRMSDETGLLMTYGADKQHVTVMGTMMTSGGGGMMGGSPRNAGSVEMVFRSGRWVISTVK